MHTSLFVARLLCAHGLVRTLQPSFNRTLSHPLFRLAHYGTLTRSDTQTWVWFGIRSDGRCGRDFLTSWGSETTCGYGSCCSSHGWCGVGEEYCSVAMGCQSGCTAGTKADEAKRSQGEPHEGGGAPDDHDYMDRIHHYKYDEDEYADYYHRRYGGDHGGGYHDYHHRYDHDDERPYHGYHGHDDYHNSIDDEHLKEHDYDEGHHAHGEDAHGHEGEGGGVAAHPHDADYLYDHPDAKQIPPEHTEIRHEIDSDPGPELVGLEEKRHLGTGDGVPLHGEKHASS